MFYDLIFETFFVQKYKEQVDRHLMNEMIRLYISEIVYYFPTYLCFNPTCYTIISNNIEVYYGRNMNAMFKISNNKFTKLSSLLTINVNTQTNILPVDFRLYYVLPLNLYSLCP